MSESIEQSDLRRGYKEVRIGPKTIVIPADWQLTSLSPEEGGTELVTDGSHYSPDQDQEEEYYYATVSDLTDSGINFESCGRIDEEQFEEMVRGGCKPKPGDVLFSKDGTVGICTTFTEEHDVVLLSSIAIIRPNTDIFSPTYLSNYLSSKLTTDQIRSFKSGTALRRVILRDIKKFQVPTPPLPEQRRIADILSTVDEQIQQTDKIIEETKALKYGLMQDLLIRGIGHDDFQEVYFGPESVEIPASWDIVKLGDVIDQYRGGASLSSNDFTDDGVPVIPKGGINQRGVLRIPEEDQQCCSNEYAHSNKSSLVSEGDLVTVSRDLVSSAPNIGRVVEVPDREYIIAQGVNAMEINDDQLNPQYLIYLSNSHLYRNHMKRIKVGSTQVHIRKDDFLSTPIPCPPIEEQSETVDVLSAAEQQIREETDRKSNLQELKRGLMQDLLTGKVRVNTD